MLSVAPPSTLQAHPDKYGHVERECRYLLSQWPPGLIPQSEHRRIIDHYFVGMGLRLRHVYRPATGESLWKLTQKVRVSPADATRILTTTLYLSEREHDAFLNLEWRRIVKDRYRLDHGGRCYGIDVFHDALAGLILAETECDSDEELEGLTLPDFAVHDVSREEAFTGAVLAYLTLEDGQALVRKLREL